MSLRPGLIVGLSVIVAVSAFAPAAVSLLGQARADRIVAPLTVTEDAHQTTLNVARWAARWFVVDQDYRPLFGSLLALQSRSIPSPLRLSRGSLAIWDGRGACSELSRALELVFRAAGLEAVQHDLVSPRDGHAALSVRVDGSWVFIDPFHGLALVDAGKLVSLRHVQSRVEAGADITQFLLPLRDDVDASMYADVTSIAHARMHEPLWVDVAVPPEGETVTLGRVDGRSADVLEMGRDAGLTTHLSYVGPRYRPDLRFRFVLDESERGFRIAFRLLGEPSPGHLPRSNLAPTLSGRVLSYDVPKGMTLELDYAAMRRSLSRRLRRATWYHVDTIRIEPLASR